MFLLHGVEAEEDLERFGRFVEEWNSYRESDKLAAWPVGQSVWVYSWLIFTN